MIAHIVLFTPKAEAAEESLRAFAQTAMELLGQIPDVSRVLIGRSVSVDTGSTRFMGQTTYTHAAVLEFEGSRDLVNYLNHPAHAELGRLFWEMCSAATVIEVDARRPADWAADELV